MALIKKEKLLYMLDTCLAECDAQTPITDAVLKAVKHAVEQMPEIDAAPVVHGEWISIPHKSTRVCSRCESDEPYKNAPDDTNIFYYCPHCGAKMNGGKKNDRT